MPKEHVFDQVSQELTDWMGKMTDWASSALVGDAPSPFSKPLSKQERLAYWYKRAFNPDGTPNQEGRSAILNGRGVPVYQRVMRSLKDAGMTGQSEIYDATQRTEPPDVPTPKEMGLP